MLKLRIVLWPVTNLLHHNLVLGQYRHGAGRFEALSSLGEADRRKVRYFEGHYGYGIHKLLPNSCIYVTLLRNPIERTVSTYFHLQTPAVRERLGVPQTNELKELMMMGQSWGGAHYFDNCHVRYLAGQSGQKVDVPFGACTREMLDLAKERLERAYFCFGITEYFDESVILLQRTLNWKLGFYVRKNVTKRRRPVDAYDEGTLSLIREYNELDMELYRFASELFFKRIEASGQGFAFELAKFTRRNRILNTVVARFS